MEEETDKNSQADPHFKLICSDYPAEFFLDKTVCKTYFRQYGKVKRLIFKQKQRMFTVEYTNEDDFLNALTNAGDFNGHQFKVYPADKPETVKRKKLISRHSISYVDKDEINEELAAMGGYAQLKLPSSSPPKQKARPKIKRLWKTEETKSPTKLLGPKRKAKVREKSTSFTPEQQELLKIVRSQAVTNEEKYRVLDARDKLLRIKMKKSTKLKSSATVGTCPDMCPEKERLMRETQHQIALYEQDDNDRHVMNPNKAVKQYSRSSADQETPLPHELRPVHVLQMTMTYLMINIMDLCDSGGDVNIAEWYHFLWDRTRGIRKDITQQASCCLGSVELVEQCARFHIHCSARLVAEDPSVFDQKINTENLTKCLQTLKYMYHDLRLKGEVCANEAEFRAYVILLNLMDGNFMWEVQEFDTTIQKSPEVKFALQVYSAFEKRNYVKFFKLVKSTTYLNACILMRYFVQVRVTAVETLLRCFTPPKSFSLYPIKDLTELLAFDDEESAIDFMKTYGMSVNNEKTHFVLVRSAFVAPEFPYLQDRSLNVVESKRTTSVGNVVCGKNISPERNMLILNHETRNSFDGNGYIIFDDAFKESDASFETVVMSDEDGKEGSTTQFVLPPVESKSVLHQNVAESKSIFGKKPDATNIFAVKTDVKPPEVGNIFGQTKEPSVFASKPESSNLFSTQDSTAKESFGPSLFGQKLVKPQDEQPPLFGVPRDEPDASSNLPSSNIFGKTVVMKPLPEQSSSVFGENLFQKSVEEKSTSIFGQPKASTKSIFAVKEPSTNIFQPQTQTQPFLAATTEPKKGGFTFALPTLPQEKKFEVVPAANEEKPRPAFGFGSGLVNRQEVTMTDRNHWQKQLEEYKEIEAHKRRQEEIDKLEEKRQQILSEINREIEREEEVKREMEERRLEAERLKKAEEERKKIEEEKMRIEEEQRKIAEEARKKAEEARRRAEEEVRKLAEAKQRRLQELERKRQRELEELRQKTEREKTVKSLLSEIVEKIDKNIRDECLVRIRNNIKRRMVIRVYEKWRDIAARSRKKRKAIDCSAGWINTRNTKQCAEELHTKSQDLTLQYIKRYKCGKPLDIAVVEDPEIERIDMFKMTYALLRRRLYEIKEKWHKHVYWKVTVSVPDHTEMSVGLRRIEDTLDKLVNWEQHPDGTEYYVETHKTATYCIEKQRGFKVNNYDSNGLVFIAKTFTPALQRRIFENLKHFGVFTKLPIVIVLEEATLDDIQDYLASLRDTGIVSEYVVFTGHFKPDVLARLVRESVVFLAKHVEKSPPLQLDTLYSFLTKNLCTEIWKKAASFAKWNSEYKLCVRDPNVVIKLYNEGVRRLKEIVLKEATKEYAVFPEVFKRYLPEEAPDFLPCDYRYFPDFWTDPEYRDQLADIFNDLTLPEFHEKWPPKSESQLFETTSKFCSKVFRNPKHPTIAVYNILKENIAESESDDSLKFKEVVWISVIETLAVETLKEQHLSLVGTQFRDAVFKTFVVVYNVNDVNDYITSDWFYRNNPLIENYKQRNAIIASQVKPAKKRSILDSSADKTDLFDVIAKAECVLRSPKVKCVVLPGKDELEYISKSLDDLEDSIRVMRKVDEMGLLRRIVDEK